MKRWEIYLEIMMEIILVLASLFIIGYVLPKTLAFLWPLVAGWLIAVVAHPVQKLLQKRLKVSKKLGSAVMVVLVIAFVCGAFYLAGSKLIQEGMSFVNSVPEIYHEAEHNIVERWGSIKGILPDSIADKVAETMKKLVTEITKYIAPGNGAKYLSSLAQSVTNGVIGVIVMFMSSYFFLADWENLHNGFHKLMKEDLMVRYTVIKDNILGAVGGYLLVQLKLMLLIMVLLFIGFLILRVDYALILSILISILDALPFLGVGTALIPWAVYDFISGNITQMIGLIVLYVICLLTRQILQPKLVGNTVGLSPLMTLVLMYIGMKIAGVIGFIIAVVLGIVVKKLYELGMFDGPINRMRIRLEMLKDAE